jgi:hypothetical protein
MTGPREDQLFEQEPYRDEDDFDEDFTSYDPSKKVDEELNGGHGDERDYEMPW